MWKDTRPQLWEAEGFSSSLCEDRSSSGEPCRKPGLPHLDGPRYSPECPEEEKECTKCWAWRKHMAHLVQTKYGKLQIIRSISQRENRCSKMWKKLPRPLRVNSKSPFLLLQPFAISWCETPLHKTWNPLLSHLLFFKTRGNRPPALIASQSGHKDETQTRTTF